MPWSVAWLPDETGMVAACRDGAVVILDGDGHHVKEMTLPGDRLYTMTLADTQPHSAPGQVSTQIAVAGARGQVMIMGLAALDYARLLGRHDVLINAITFVPGARLVVSGSGDGRLNAYSLARLDIVSERRLAITTAAFSPNGSLLGGGRGDGQVRIWRTGRAHVAHGAAESQDDSFGALIAMETPHASNVVSVAFDESASRFAVGYRDGVVLVLGVKDLAEGKPAIVAKLTGHKGSVRAVHFTSNGELLTGGSDWTLRRWALSPSGAVECAAWEHESTVVAVACCQSLAAALLHDGSIHIYDLNTNRLREALAAPTGKERPLHLTWLKPSSSAVNGALLVEYAEGEWATWSLGLDNQTATPVDPQPHKPRRAWRVDEGRGEVLVIDTHLAQPIGAYPQRLEALCASPDLQTFAGWLDGELFLFRLPG